MYATHDTEAKAEEPYLSQEKVLDILKDALSEYLGTGFKIRDAVNGFIVEVDEPHRKFRVNVGDSAENPDDTIIPKHLQKQWKEHGCTKLPTEHHKITTYAEFDTEMDAKDFADALDEAIDNIPFEYGCGRDIHNIKSEPFCDDPSRIIWYQEGNMGGYFSQEEGIKLLLSIGKLFEVFKCGFADAHLDKNILSVHEGNTYEEHVVGLMDKYGLKPHHDPLEDVVCSFFDDIKENPEIQENSWEGLRPYTSGGYIGLGKDLDDWIATYPKGNLLKLLSAKTAKSPVSGVRYGVAYTFTVNGDVYELNDSGDAMKRISRHFKVARWIKGGGAGGSLHVYYHKPIVKGFIKNFATYNAPDGKKYPVWVRVSGEHNDKIDIGVKGHGRDFGEISPLPMKPTLNNIIKEVQKVIEAGFKLDAEENPSLQRRTILKKIKFLEDEQGGIVATIQLDYEYVGKKAPQKLYNECDKLEKKINDLKYKLDELS